MGLKDLGGDLLPPVGGQAVLHHAAGIGDGHQGLVDLVAPEGGPPLGGLLLLAHGGPHVGEHHVDPRRGLQGIPHQGEPVARLPGEGQHIGVGVIALGAGHGHLHAHLQAAHNEGVDHVVAVADEAHLQPLQPSLALPDGHEVGQHLAGVGEVGEAVDDGDVGIPGQLLHLLLGVGADHDAVAVAGEHPGGVLHRLAPADLALPAGEEEGVAPQLEHAGLKGDPGAGGVLLEDHGQGLALEAGVGQAVLLVVLHLVSHVQDADDLLSGEIQQLQQVFHLVHLIQKWRAQPGVTPGPGPGWPGPGPSRPS